MRITDKYVFFWKESPFCNFSKCKIKFADPYIVPLEDEPMIFTSSEQLFMYYKAIFFGDTETASKIYDSKTPKEAKALGREVKNYDNDLWDSIRDSYMYKAVSYKFIQNKNLRNILTDKKYDDLSFVEASPYDRIWGIGYSEDYALKLDNYKNWGQNRLGEILNKVRDLCISNEDILDD